MIKVGLILLFFFYPLLSFQLFGIGSFGVTSSDLIIFLLNLIFIYKFVWNGVKLELPKYSIHIFLFLLTIFIFFSGVPILFEVDEGLVVQFFKTFAHYLYLYLFVFFSISFKFDEKIFYNLLKTFLIASIFVNAYGIYQLIARALNLPGGWVDLNNASLLSRLNEGSEVEVQMLALQFKDFYRATSLFSEPSILVHFNFINLIFLAIPYINKTKRIITSKPIAIFMFILILINLFLTFSLTAVIGLTIMIIMSMKLEKRSLINLYFKIFSVSAILLVIFDYIIKDIVGLSVLGLLGERISSVFMYIFFGEDNLVSGESVTGRLGNVYDSIVLWFSSPIFGIGLGLYAKKSELFNFSDNSLLNILAECGPFAALSFIGLFFSTMYYSLKLRKSTEFKKTEIQSTIINMTPYLSFVLIQINFLTANSYLTITTFILFFIILGIISSIYSYNGKVTFISFSQISFKSKFQNSILKYLKKQINEPQ